VWPLTISDQLFIPEALLFLLGPCATIMIQTHQLRHQVLVIIAGETYWGPNTRLRS